MMDNELKNILRACLMMVMKTAFINPSKHSDEEGFGLLLSKYFEWSPDSIMKVVSFALEDANCHTLKTEVDNLMQDVVI